MPLFLMYLENRIVVVVCGFYKIVVDYAIVLWYNRLYKVQLINVNRKMKKH